jgi:DDE family transposase
LAPLNQHYDDSDLRLNLWADNWVDIEMYGNAKRDWFASFLDLQHGIPSHDTFGRVFRQINPEEFQARFHEWTSSLRVRLPGEVLSVDGKTERGSKDGPLGLAALEMVSVWASENELVLAQDRIDEGTNEITVIPELLGLLDLEDAIVMIDAIGCQTQIAEAILSQDADYILALRTIKKGSSRILLQPLNLLFQPSQSTTIKALTNGASWSQAELSDR